MLYTLEGGLTVLYICSEEHDYLGILDTEDGKFELVTPRELLGYMLSTSQIRTAHEAMCYRYICTNEYFAELIKISTDLNGALYCGDIEYSDGCCGLVGSEYILRIFDMLYRVLDDSAYIGIELRDDIQCTDKTINFEGIALCLYCNDDIYTFKYENGMVVTEDSISGVAYTKYLTNNVDEVAKGLLLESHEYPESFASYKRYITRSIKRSMMLQMGE